MMLNANTYFGAPPQLKDEGIIYNSSATNLDYTAYLSTFRDSFETYTRLTIKFKAAYNTVDPVLKNWLSPSSADVEVDVFKIWSPVAQPELLSAKLFATLDVPFVIDLTTKFVTNMDND